MLETWEIRWFGKGAIPLPLQQWSEELSFTLQPVRTDYYLLHSAGDRMGIKWREGSIQVKEQLDKANYIEHYKKWGFELADKSQLNKIEEDNHWIAVSKKREMIKFSVKKGKLTRIELNEEDRGSVEVELSAVMCAEELWWTIAYEATANKNNLESVLKEHKPPILVGSERQGYAKWLMKNFAK